MLTTQAEQGSGVPRLGSGLSPSRIKDEELGEKGGGTRRGMKGNDGRSPLKKREVTASSSKFKEGSTVEDKRNCSFPQLKCLAIKNLQKQIL